MNKKKAEDRFGRLYGKKTLLFAAAALIIGVLGFLFLKSNGSMNPLAGTLHFQNPQETAAGADGSLYVNDGGKRLIGIRPDGTLKYVTEIGNHFPNSRVSGITADGDGNLFLIITRYIADGITISNEGILEFGPDGKLKGKLSSKDYTGSAAYDTNLSNLFVSDGKITYADMKERKAEFYSVDIPSRRTEKLFEIPYQVPFEYQCIAVKEGGYEYLKLDGELGSGKTGGAEIPMLDYSSSPASGSPFLTSLYPLGQADYGLDSNTGKVWLVGQSCSFADLFALDPVMNGKKISSLRTDNGYLTGTADQGIWRTNDLTDTVFRDSVLLTPLQRGQEILIRVLHFLSMLLLILFAVYAVGLVIRVYAGPSSSLILKQLFLVPIFAGVFFLMLFTLFREYRKSYIDRDCRRIADALRIEAASIDASLVKEAGNTEYFETEAYRKLTDRLMTAFGQYTGADAEATAAVLLPVREGYYIAADTSNSCRIFSRFHPEDTVAGSIEAEIENGADENGVATVKGSRNYRFYAAIRQKDGRTVGFLCAETPIAHQNRIFYLAVRNMLPVILSGLLLIAAILTATAFLIGRNARKASEAITAIAGGNLSVRIPKTGNDEIGRISLCVNEMAESLESSFRRNRELNEEIRRAQIEVIASFAEITEEKSGQTGQHIRRVAAYMKILAGAAGYPEEEAEKIAIASMLHDIGKLLIPNEILEKPSRLSTEEFEIMKKHPAYGEQILKNAPGQIMHYARIIAGQHQERYNGTGYPGHLKGDQIDRTARMAAIVDVFDALTAKRSYKEGWSFDRAFRELRLQEGKLFDPELTELFLGRRNEIEKAEAVTTERMERG